MLTKATGYERVQAEHAYTIHVFVRIFVHLQPAPAEEDAGAASAVAAQAERGDQETAATPPLAAAERRFRQQFHVLACRVSTSGEHVWSLVVENNGQVK